MKKTYIPLLITLLILGIVSGNAFSQDFGQRRIQTPRKENRKVKDEVVTIDGVVKDASGKALAKVLVSGKEGAIEVLTDDQGHFTITVPKGSDLLFESEGLETKAVSLAENIPTEVTMNKAGFLMEERNKVNIAFGQVYRKELVNAVSTIDTKELKKYDDTESFYDALTGKIPGLLGNNNLRGMGNALIVVDGVPRDASNLNISEIDQISVLKDGSAAMLYGGKAKNGVILVTTRRGQAFKRKIDVSYEKGFSTPIALPQYLGSADYFKYYNEARLNDGLSIARADSVIAHYADGKNPYRYPSLDYYSSEFLKSSKPFQRVLTEMSGGNETTQYYANVGWNRSGTLFNIGDAKNYSANRFNMRGNVNFKVNEYIKSSVDAVIIFDMDKQPYGDFWGNAATIHPEYFSPLLPISSIRKTTANKAIITPAKKINDNYILGGTSQYTSNPYGLMYLGGYQTDNRRTATVTANIEVDLKNITQGLKFKTYGSYDVHNRYYITTGQGRSFAIYNPTWNTFGSSDSIMSLAQTGTDTNSGTQSIPTYSTTINGNQYVTPYFERRIGVSAMLDYDRTFGGANHWTSTLLAYWDKFKINNLIIDDKDAYLGLRIGYDYKQKYLIDFTSTYSNGFRLPEGKRGSWAPSVGLAWNISEEGFLKESKVVNFLKLRASAAIQDIDPVVGTLGQEFTPYRNSFGSGSYFSFADGTRGGSGDNLRSVNLLRSDNLNLTFERMKSLNGGLEGYFFNRFLYLDANVFYNRYDGQVVRRNSEYPSWIGNNNPYENYNVTDYWGGELGLTLQKSIGKFYMQVGGNLLYADSKRVKVNEIQGESYLYRQGKSADALFGLQDLGLFKNTTDISSNPIQKFSTPRPGDIRYQDINKDNKVDANDQIMIGNTQAKYAYGLTVVLKYGGLSLMATGDGMADYDRILSGGYFWIQSNDKYSTEILNRWTPATATTATYPRLSSQANSNNFQNSTYWKISGNYFRLNRAQLTYDVPKKALSNCPTKEISIYVRGSNLNMWTTKQFQKQLNIGGEPNYRSYALGVNILF